MSYRVDIDDIDDDDRRDRRAHGRDSVSNGTRLLQADGRGRGPRRFRYMYDRLLSDFGRTPTAAQDQQLRRAAQLSVRCEDMEAAWAEDPALADDERYARASEQLRRTLRVLGLLPDPPRVRGDRSTTRRKVAGGDGIDMLLAKKGYAREGVNVDDLPADVRAALDHARACGLPKPIEDVDDADALALDDDAITTRSDGVTVIRRPLPAPDTARTRRALPPDDNPKPAKTRKSRGGLLRGRT